MGKKATHTDWESRPQGDRVVVVKGTGHNHLSAAKQTDEQDSARAFVRLTSIGGA